jgi:hypothetical protein
MPDAYMPTLITCIHMPTQGCRTAAAHSIKRSPLPAIEVHGIADSIPMIVQDVRHFK